MKPLLIALLLALAIPAFALAGEADSFIVKGNGLVQKKEYKKALAEYEKAVKADPKSAKANLLLGMSYANTGDMEKAVRYTEASVKIEPSFAAYNNLGLIWANRADFAKASAMYEKALALNPAAYRTWYQSGLTHAASGDFAKAITAYQKSVELNPSFADGLIGLGSAYYWSGNRTAALEQVIRLRTMKQTEKADTLESWLQNKERKKLGEAAPAV